MKLLQMAALMSLLLVSLTGAAVAQAARELPFGDGKAAVTIPEIYQKFIRYRWNVAAHRAAA